MKTYINIKFCELYPTDKENWENFDVIDDYSDLSDFNSWAMDVAKDALFGKECDMWVWTNSQISIDNYYENEILRLCLTKNGILVLKVYERDTFEQTEQYVVKMLHYQVGEEE